MIHLIRQLAPLSGAGGLRVIVRVQSNYEKRHSPDLVSPKQGILYLR